MKMATKWIVASLIALALVAQSTPSRAASTSSESTLSQAGYGAGSVLGTLVYSPLKASFCILGGIGSAFTAIVSPETASRVVGASCRGTWMITPDVLKGRERVQVVGDVPPTSTGAGKPSAGEAHAPGR